MGEACGSLAHESRWRVGAIGTGEEMTLLGCDTFVVGVARVEKEMEAWRGVVGGAEGRGGGVTGRFGEDVVRMC